MPAFLGRAASRDGTALLTRHWPAAGSGPAPAAVLLVHGLGEHSGRYEHVGARMAALGLDVHAYDQRGNGGSGGRRGDLDGWSRQQDDLEDRLAAVRAAGPARPIVLYGHSLGGLLVLGYLLTDRPGPDLAVLSAPGLDSTLPAWKLALAPIAARLVPWLSLPNGIDPATLSRDAAVGARLAADPLAARTTTARAAAAALREQARVLQDYRRLAIPTLVIHGEDDGLVPVAASEALATVPGVERRTYPGLRHELHNEPEGPAVIDAVTAWIRERATIRTEPNIASGERPAR